MKINPARRLLTAVAYGALVFAPTFAQAADPLSVYGMALTNTHAQQVPSPPVPALAQSGQSATPANNATTHGEDVTIASNTSLTKLDQKKQLASVRNKLIAEKGKAWARELIPVSATASNEAGQGKPAAPAAGDAAELRKA